MTQTLTLPVDLGQVQRGSPVAVFQRGFDAYRMRGAVELHGTNGSSAAGTIVASEVGRLFALAQRFVGQNIYAGPAAAAAPGYYAPDAALFDALDQQGDPQALHPMEPYTVLLVTLPPQAPTP